MSELRFDGRVVAVTGGGRGLGRAHALLLAARGARVIVNDVGSGIEGDGRDARVAESVVTEIAAAGGIAVASSADVAGTDGAEALITTAVETFGGLDGVVCNAGIKTLSDFPRTSSADLVRHLEVHVLGAYAVCRAAWPSMVERGYGRIVCTGSAAFLGGSSGGGSSVLDYAIAKSALIGLVKNLAAEGAPHGILVNLVAPLANTRMAGAAGYPGGDAALVSPAVALLLHESCPANGELISVGMGRVARMLLRETRGFVDPQLTPEALRDNWSVVLDERDTLAASDIRSYIAAFARLAGHVMQEDLTP